LTAHAADEDEDTDNALNIEDLDEAELIRRALIALCKVDDLFGHDNWQTHLSIQVQAHLENADRLIGLAHDGQSYTISDSGADTYVICEKGWAILEVDPIHTANLVAFDPTKMQKPGCLIITAATVLKDWTGQRLLWIVRDAVYNKGGDVSLMSEFQTCEYGIAIDSVSK